MQTSTYKGRLVARRKELSDRLHRIEGDLDVARSNDDDDRAIEREGDEVLEALGEAGLAELKAIEAALVRIDEGRFGVCTRCGLPIPEKRLNAVLHATLCVTCVAETQTR